MPTHHSKRPRHLLQFQSNRTIGAAFFWVAYSFSVLRLVCTLNELVGNKLKSLIERELPKHQQNALSLLLLFYAVLVLARASLYAHNKFKLKASESIALIYYLRSLYFPSLMDYAYSSRAIYRKGE